MTITAHAPARWGSRSGSLWSEVSSEVRASVIDRRALFDRLECAMSGRVTVLSGPAGSGKTFLLRSWLESTGQSAAWVNVEPDESDPAEFCRSVLDAVEATGLDVATRGSWVPGQLFDTDLAAVELLSRLDGLTQSLVLVIDNLQDLTSPAALQLVGLLLERQPADLHLVLVSREDPKLGLQRLRLAGQLTEIRATDLRYTVHDTRELLAASGVLLSDAAVAALHEKTEGWAAGVRLAALSLGGLAEPEPFAAVFSGSERTVAEYLTAEVLDRQPADVRELLLRTSVVEEVSGPLADTLTGGMRGEATLRALEGAGAFVVALDPARSWFRYHHLLGDVLRHELSRAHPEEVPGLHVTAARWLAEHGRPAEAIVHAQTGGDQAYAVRLLVEHFFSLTLDGRYPAAHELLGSFALDQMPPDPELMVVVAADHLGQRLFDQAAWQIRIAEKHSAAVPADRRNRFEVSLALVRLWLARLRGDFTSVAAQTATLRGVTSPTSNHEITLNTDLRALALMNLGIVEAWSGRPEEAVRHLEEASDLARRGGRRYLEVSCLAHLAATAAPLSFTRTEVACRQVVAVAEAAGWGADPVVAPALVKLASVLAQTGSFEEAERCLDRAEQSLQSGLEPPVAFVLSAVRGSLASVRGDDEEALLWYRRADRIRGELADQPPLDLQIRCGMLDANIRLGRTGVVRETLAGLTDVELDTGEVRAILAHLALAETDPSAALLALVPVLDGSAPVHHQVVVVRSQVLAAAAHDLLGDSRARRQALERALDLAEPDRLVLPFAHTNSRWLFDHHLPHESAHGTFVAEILDVLSGNSLRPRPVGDPGTLERLSETELRILRYLPSNLAAPEIAAELSVSVNTVKTHLRHIYAKLDAHTRTEAVQRARGFALLAPPVRLR